MFRSLALSGGGVRGILHVGGLAALEKRMGNLSFPDGVYGCSIGAVVATAVAFNLTAEQIKNMVLSDFDLSFIVPSLRLSSIQNVLERKGAFSMENFETTLLTSFANQGIDLRGKRIKDAPQKLFIGASNLTTRRAVFFSGNVPVLDALKCSCCVPLVFEPQVLFGNVYLDGGLYIPRMNDAVPEKTLIFHISYTPATVTPEYLADCSVSDFIKELYVGKEYRGDMENTLWFKENSVHILQNVTLEDKERLWQDGRSQAAAFLAKRFPEELEQPVGSGAL
jgi:hypothetical protein